MFPMQSWLKSISFDFQTEEKGICRPSSLNCMSLCLLFC